MLLMVGVQSEALSGANILANYLKPAAIHIQPIQGWLLVDLKKNLTGLKDLSGLVGLVG